jgi:hypothetical protein
MADYKLTELDFTDKAKVKEKAIEMTEDGFCTHYPGYTCDKDFPEECPKCIGRWLRTWHKRHESAVCERR